MTLTVHNSVMMLFMESIWDQWCLIDGIFTGSGIFFSILIYFENNFKICLFVLFLFHLLCICVNAFLQNNNQIHIVCLEYNFHYIIEIRKVEEVTALETRQMITLYTGLNNIKKKFKRIFFSRRKYGDIKPKEKSH